MRNAYFGDAVTPTVPPSDDTIAAAWSSSPLGDPAADINSLGQYDFPQPVGAPASIWSRGKTPLILALVGALGAGAVLGAVLLDNIGSPNQPQTTSVVPGAIVRSATAPAMVASDLNAAVPPSANGLPPAVQAPPAAPPALGPAPDSAAPAVATIPVPDDGTPPADPGPPPPPDAGPPPPPDAGPPPPPVFLPPVVVPGPVVIVNGPGPQWGPPPPPHVLPPPPPPLHFTPVPAPPHVVPVTLPPLPPPPPPPHVLPPLPPACKAPAHLVSGHCV